MDCRAGVQTSPVSSIDASGTLTGSTTRKRGMADGGASPGSVPTSPMAAWRGTGVTSATARSSGGLQVRMERGTSTPWSTRPQQAKSFSTARTSERFDTKPCPSTSSRASPTRTGPLTAGSAVRLATMSSRSDSCRMATGQPGQMRGRASTWRRRACGRSGRSAGRQRGGPGLVRPGSGRGVACGPAYRGPGQRGAEAARSVLRSR